MGSVEQIIDYILEQSQFDLGYVYAKMVGGKPSRAWASKPGEVISVHELRQLLSSEDSDAVDPVRAREARLVCPEATLSPLVDHLRVLLNDYIDVDEETVGHSFPKVSNEYARGTTTAQADGLCAVSCITGLQVLARALVKGSALVGSRTVGSLLAGWVEGQPVQYRTCAVLNGIYIKGSLEPVAGIRIAPLPLSSDELPDDLPFLSSRAPEAYLGRTIVCVDTLASPPLFRPEQDGARNPVQASNQSIADVDAVCKALALESDDFVDIAFQWNDYGELLDVFPTRESSTWGGSGLRPQWSFGSIMTTDFRTGVVTASPVNQPLSDLDESSLGHTIKALMEPKHKGTRISVARLIKSRDSSQGLVDQFVDLRMALETLFLKDFTNEQSQEMRFRLSLFGAWFLGQDFEDRRRIRKVLRDAYDAASAAVHTSNVSFTNDNRELLANAQRLCHRGILKLLREGPPTDWGDMVLGSAGV